MGMPEANRAKAGSMDACDGIFKTNVLKRTTQTEIIVDRGAARRGRALASPLGSWAMTEARHCPG